MASFGGSSAACHRAAAATNRTTAQLHRCRNAVVRPRRGARGRGTLNPNPRPGAQVVRGRYSKEADIWSAGVIMYILLCGLLPFSGNTELTVFERVLNAPLDFSSDPWPRVSDDAKDCIRCMLQRVCRAPLPPPPPPPPPPPLATLSCDLVRRLRGTGTSETRGAGGEAGWRGMVWQLCVVRPQMPKRQCTAGCFRPPLHSKCGKLTCFMLQLQRIMPAPSSHGCISDNSRSASSASRLQP